MNNNIEPGGEIKYIKASEIIPISQYLPGAEAANIWLALHSTIQGCIGLSSDDPLSQRERRLYEALSKKFYENLEMGEYFTATEIRKTE